MSPENHKLALEKNLWAVADQLRGQMDASEYQRYALGVIFYKYLSELTEKKVHDLADAADAETMTVQQIVESPDYEGITSELWSDLGFVIKPEYLFSTLVAEVERGTQGSWSTDLLASAFTALQESTVRGPEGQEAHAGSERAFEGLFDDVNLFSPALGSTPEARNHRMGQIVKAIGQIDFRLEDAEIDVLGDAYEYMIAQFASGAGKKGGEFYTPQAVSTLVSRILAHENPDLSSVYDPTCGSGSLLLRIVKEAGKTPGNRASLLKIRGQEWNTTTYNLARMNMLLHGVRFTNFDIRNGDTLTDDKFAGEKFDAIGANPPYSLAWDQSEALLQDPRFQGPGKLAPKNAADFAFIQHIVHHLNPDHGVAAVVLPHGVLFRGGAEAAIRSHLLSQNVLHAVIGLPGNLFYGTSIPTAVLVFKKGRAEGEPVMFIDASREFAKGKNQNSLKAEHLTKIMDAYEGGQDVELFARAVPVAEIEENDNNLNIPRYVDSTPVDPPVDLEAVQADIVAQKALLASLEAKIMDEFSKLVRTDA